MQGSCEDNSSPVQSQYVNAVVLRFALLWIYM